MDSAVHMKGRVRQCLENFLGFVVERNNAAWPRVGVHYSEAALPIRCLEHRVSGPRKSKGLLTMKPNSRINL